MGIGRWTGGIYNPLVLLCLLFIRIYQAFISPLLGKNCRFYPTCSQYAYEALLRFGLMRGMWLAVIRILRCGPWHPGGYDPVPSKKWRTF